MKYGNWLRLASALCAVGLLACQSSTLTAAKLYIKQEKPGKAKEQLLQALETEPDNPEVHYLLGTLQGEDGDHAAMVDAFHSSLELSAEFAGRIDEHCRYYWARAYNQGVRLSRSDSPDYPAAQQCFHDATVIIPDSLQGWRNLAYVYYQMEDLDSAIEVYERIAADAPSDTTSINSLGVLCLSKGRMEDADRAFSRVLELDPRHTGALINLAVICTDTERLDEAEDLYLRAIAADPEAAQPHYNLGNLYWNAKRFDEAAAAYRQAMALTPEDVDVRFNLAVTYLSLDDPDNALPLLLELSEQTPDNGSVWRELSRTYAIKDMPEESKHAHQMAEALGK